MARSQRRHPATEEAREQLAEFLRASSTARVFRYPTSHPAGPTGFCACDPPGLGMLRVWLRGALLETVLKLPSNRLKLRVLRRVGVSIGRGVYISPGAWVDPVYPQLISIEDGVFIGTGARIFTHEFRRDEFRAGRVIIRRGAFVGAHSLIACGVEIGEDATVAAGTALARDVPSGYTALGNPARIVPRRAEPEGTEIEQSVKVGAGTRSAATDPRCR